MRKLYNYIGDINGMLDEIIKIESKLDVIK